MLDGLTITVQYRDGTVVLSNRRLVSLRQVQELRDPEEIVVEIAKHLWQEIDSELERIND